MSAKILWRRDGGVLFVFRALADLCRRLGEAAEAPAIMTEPCGGTSPVSGPVLSAISALSAGFRLVAETQQFEGILFWGLNGPESECGDAPSRFAAELADLRRAFKGAYLEIDAWLLSLEGVAGSLDETGRLVIAHQARVEGDEYGGCGPERVVVPCPEGGGDA